MMRSSWRILTMSALLLAGCAEEAAETTPAAPGGGETVSDGGMTRELPADVVAAAASESSAPEETAPAGDATVFQLTAENTQVLFTGTKKSGDSHSGGFNALSGNITLGDSGISALSVVIETDSLYSDADRLTGHLKNEDFFSVNEFPELRFESTKIEGEGPVTVTGNLTMHGETAEISFPATVSVTDGNVTLSSEFKVDRTKFGMNYTGQPNDPINAEVDIKVLVGQTEAAETE